MIPLTSFISLTSALLTAAVLLTWGGIAACAFGIGALFLRCVAVLERTWRDALLSVLCGLALVFAFLLVWHFVLPVNHWALLVCAGTGAVGLIRERAWFPALLASLRPSKAALALTVLMVWAANHALMRGGWDDYVYEYQVVRWFHDFAIVPGLANLHGRLGFNSSQHLYAAMLSTGPWTGTVNILVNGLFVSLMLLISVAAFRELLRGNVSARAIFAAALFAPCLGRFILLAELSQPMISTLKADVLAAALALITACLWLEFADETTPGPRRKVLAVTIALVGWMLFSVRIGSLPYVAVLSGAATVWLARGTESRRAFWVVLAVTVVFVAAVTARGVVMTGYPFYPATLFGFDVDWRVPIAQAEVERTFILTHAQARPAVRLTPPEGEWIVKWLRALLLTNRITYAVPLGIVLCLAPVFFWRRAAERYAGPPLSGWMMLWAATVGALILWFMNAPSARFAWGYYWILFASFLAFAVDRRPAAATAGWPAVTLTGLSLVALFGFGFTRSEAIGFLWALLFVLIWSTAFVIVAHRGSRAAIVGLLVILGTYPIADRLSADLAYRRFHQMKWIFWLNPSRMPAPDEDFPMLPRQTDSGLTIYEAPFAKYDSPLPTTPYFNRYLELRTPGSLGGGFRNTSRRAYPLFGYRPGFGTALPDQ